MNVIVSDFARQRHLPEREFSHYAGDLADLPVLVTQHWGAREKGYRDGVVLVPVPADGFFSATVTLKEGDELRGTYKARVPGERPRKSTGVVGGTKTPAKQVKLVLYHRDVLAEGNENTPNGCPACGGTGYSEDHAPDACHSCDNYRTAEWEIISINASATEGPEPMDVGTLLANYFHEAGSNDGGTAMNISESEFVAKLREAYLFGRDKARIWVGVGNE